MANRSHGIWPPTVPTSTRLPQALWASFSSLENTPIMAVSSHTVAEAPSPHRVPLPLTCSSQEVTASLRLYLQAAPVPQPAPSLYHLHTQTDPSPHPPRRASRTPCSSSRIRAFPSRWFIDDRGPRTIFFTLKADASLILRSATIFPCPGSLSKLRFHAFPTQGFPAHPHHHGQ